METGNYVNSPNLSRTNQEGQNISERSKLYRPILISFGLLCIIQSALNVCLRLQADSFSNTLNEMRMSRTNMTAFNVDLNVTQLEKEITEMKAINKFLRGNITLFKKKVSKLRKQIGQLHVGCPSGWLAHQSSCYQLSPTTDTWENARQDCERKEASLVILDDYREEKFVRLLGGVKFWISFSHANGQNSLSCKQPLNQIPPKDSLDSKDCAIIEGGDLCLLSLSFQSCDEFYYWMCEKARTFI
ncbi:C-type lectin domain family 12 member B-like [Echeneis naucrates]|uniref:C-type lectin domain family 12 member B-like n=1 Tax=Echeneis naucrates TaxID=173247 RepID=UPI0011144FD3|nr:C-type lectin domain family 12 member B-like [Echeneis naucrates]